MFTDHLTVKLIAGKGGNGVVAWRREKYLPKGGPYGGNGGLGGAIILKASEHLVSLDALRNQRQIRAPKGSDGGTAKRAGQKGRDLVIEVPCGTLIRDADTLALLEDLSAHGDTWIACTPGRGGRGNATFVTPTNRAPNICTRGKPGQERSVILELKTIADIGLIGFPNAGKSSLLRALSRSDAKVGAYPFTTLHPNIGFMEFEDYLRAAIADVPGIIEKASENKGLGLDFLRHIERTEILLFVLDSAGVDGRDPEADFRILKKELDTYDKKLLNRPKIVALNKADLEESEEHIAAFKKAFPDEKTFIISTSSEQGLKALKEALHSAYLTLHPPKERCLV